MRKLLVACLLLLTLFTAEAQQRVPAKQSVPKQSSSVSKAANGYNIRLKLTPLKSQLVYVYSYFGKNYRLADSAMLDANSQAVFKGNSKLPGGIYIVVTANRTRLFDFLMDETQQFTITADTSDINNVTFSGSRENDLYASYTRFLTQKVPEINAAQERLKKAQNKTDSASIRAELKAAEDAMNAFREKVMKEQPSSMLATFFNTMKKPEIPPVPVINGKPDSAYPFRYVKEHYWDDVDFGDGRLLRTPFFDPKIDEYFKYYVYPVADSIIPEVNFMLLSARPDPDMFHYLLGKFTDKYINPEIMGQDKVFVFLFNNFYSKGDTGWLNTKQREYIFNRAYSLITNQIGEKAPALNLLDSTNKDVTLSGIGTPFTFIFFWDPNCGHCKETAPRLDSFYHASWKNLGVTIYAVNIDAKANAAWKRQINQLKLKGWIHAYEPEEVRKTQQASNLPNFRQLYDVSQTPTMYLLDKDKRIMAKKLSLEQFHELIVLKAKQTK